MLSDMNTPSLTTVFEVFYTAVYPAYPGEERSQLFSSRDEAKRMQAFCETCGSKSRIVERTLSKM